jgi:hypothetical protein
VKVYICRGTIYGKRELVASTVGGQKNEHRPSMNGSERRGGNGGRRRSSNNRNINSK